MLFCLTGIDNGVEAGTNEVVYNLLLFLSQSSPAVKAILPR